jgi:uncharacterized membrane protein
VAVAFTAAAAGFMAQLFPWKRGPEAVFATPFFVALTPLVALVLATWFMRRARAARQAELDVRAAEPDAPERSPGFSDADMPALAAIAHLAVLVSLEILAWGAYCELAQGLSRGDARLRAQMALSVFWAGYAGALVGLGFWRRMPPLRWSGIAIFLATIAKAFFVDLSNLDTIYRVGSFLALGALLVAASYLYQRRRN